MTYEVIKNFQQDVKQQLANINSNIASISQNDIKNIMIINAPPRSGSSLLYKILAKSENFYALTGEATPFYQLNITNHDYKNGDMYDVKQLLSEDISSIASDFIFDASITRQQLSVEYDSKDRQQYALKLAMRLVLQWPKLSINISAMMKCIHETLDNYLKKNRKLVLDIFYLRLLNQLKKILPTINPYYYDINTQIIQQNYPNIEMPSGPPDDDCLLEEPPFILVSPTKLINKNITHNKTLLLKTSIDVYNLDLIKQMFPKANLKYIFLFRNPAGSVNGLIDGWLHRGFFSHKLNKMQYGLANQLKIAGYSDKHAFGKYWWNFDLPPGWNNYIAKSLPEVCTFQWHSAIRKILSTMATIEPSDCCIVKYENLINNNLTMSAEIQQIFAAINKDVDLNLSDNMPLVQTTVHPKKYRWKQREELIFKALHADVIATASKIDYDINKLNEWL